MFRNGHERDGIFANHICSHSTAAIWWRGSRKVSGTQIISFSSIGGWRRHRFEGVKKFENERLCVL